MATETDQLVRKVTVTLPLSLLAQLDDQVPPRQRSAFIVQAIARQLAVLEQAAAVEESAGAWRDEDYPELASEEGMDRWLAELRGSAEERLTRWSGEIP
jgi:hypothetical protein